MQKMTKQGVRDLNTPPPNCTHDWIHDVIECDCVSWKPDYMNSKEDRAIPCMVRCTKCKAKRRDSAKKQGTRSSD